MPHPNMTDVNIFSYLFFGFPVLNLSLAHIIQKVKPYGPFLFSPFLETFPYMSSEYHLVSGQDSTVV